MSKTINDLMNTLRHNDILGDNGHQAGYFTWADEIGDELGTSTGGLVNAAINKGLIFKPNSDTIGLTQAGADAIAVIKASE